MINFLKFSILDKTLFLLENTGVKANVLCLFFIIQIRLGMDLAGYSGIPRDIIMYLVWLAEYLAGCSGIPGDITIYLVWLAEYLAGYSGIPGDITIYLVWLAEYLAGCSGIPGDITMYLVWLAEYLAGYLLLKMNKYPAEYSNFIHTVFIPSSGLYFFLNLPLILKAYGLNNYFILNKNDPGYRKQDLFLLNKNVF
jgi:hypothetical protein